MTPMPSICSCMHTNRTNVFIAWGYLGQIKKWRGMPSTFVPMCIFILWLISEWPLYMQYIMKGVAALSSVFFFVWKWWADWAELIESIRREWIWIGPERWSSLKGGEGKVPQKHQLFWGDASLFFWYLHPKPNLCFLYYSIPLFDIVWLVVYCFLMRNVLEGLTCRSIHFLFLFL